MNEKTNKENLEEKLHSVYQSKILLSHLVNMNSCISSAKENTKEAIKENEKISTLYQLWLNDTKEKIKSCIMSNKKKIKINSFQVKRTHSKKDKKNKEKSDELIIPDPVIFKNIQQNNFKEIFFSLIENKNKKRQKRKALSFERDSFSIDGINTELKKLKLDKEQVSHENKMEIIPEQPSREEIGDQNISLQKDQPVQPTDKEISDINQGISKTLKTPVQSNPNDINKKEDAFTFAKTNPFIYIPPSKNTTNIIYNMSNYPSSQLLLSKDDSKKNESDTQYEYHITDNSDSDYEEDDSVVEQKKSRIQKWALDKEYIKTTIINQNKNKDYIKIFGKCKIDHLNLNMIFFTTDEKYMIRNSTADWRLDSTVSPITVVDKKVNFTGNNNESNKIFPNTNRQLNFDK